MGQIREQIVREKEAETAAAKKLAEEAAKVRLSEAEAHLRQVPSRSL